MTTSAVAPASSTDAHLPFAVAPPLPHIREFREEEAEAVARMWRESASAWPGGGPGGGEHATAARVRQEHRDLNTLATFIAWAPDPQSGEPRAVGYCSLFEIPSDATAAYVGTLSAHPDWHGKGIGRDLLKAALVRTVALGYTRLDLNTWAGNLKAVPLYKKSGYFWVPDTSVRMENYLPLIFRLAPAQGFFQHADWYRDFRRDLTVQPDEEKQDKLEVYTYTWEHEGRRLRVVIDRRSKGVVTLETDAFALATGVDDPRLPIGGQRRVWWRLQNYTPRPLSVSLLAEGEDSVRCTFQSSSPVEGTQTWAAPVTAEQPSSPPPPGRPANRVRSTVVVEGQAIPLALGIQLSQPVTVSFDGRHNWLVPGTTRELWLTAENSLEEAVRGTLRLAGAPGLSLSPTSFDFDLAPRRKASWPVAIGAQTAGAYQLRAQATASLHQAAVATGDGKASGTVTGPAELRTKVFEHTLFCGEPGELLAEQREDSVSIITDRHTISIPLKPTGNWELTFQVSDRATGKRILSHACGLGPPFAPSILAAATWTARVERLAGRIVVVLSTSPATLPGVSFERVVEVSPSGLLRLQYRVINAGAVERSLQVYGATRVGLDMVQATQVAVPLVNGLVVEDSQRFPDWDEPEHRSPERYAETWMAEFAEGWVGATLWQGAKEVSASWSAPSLIFDLGTVAPGGQVETPSLYLYAGQGDWKTARALWRQLIGAQAPASDPTPRPADVLRLERAVFDGPSEVVETQLIVESERSRGQSGTVSLEVAGAEVAQGEVSGLQLGAPQTLPVRLTLPPRAAAVPAALVFSHQRSTARYDTAIIRAGTGGAQVTVEVERDGGTERVRLENGRLRLAFLPAKLARLVELSVQDAGGQWVNQLFVADPAPSTFVWFNPWFGGVHPAIYGPGWWSHPGKLREETFTWDTVTSTGKQGVQWHGLRASTETTAIGQAGLKLDVSYLTTAGSNLVAVVVRLENRSGARFNGDLELHTFLQPAGERKNVTLHYERFGPRTQKRVHGGMWASSGQWCAVEAQAGPTLALVLATPEGYVETGDMGHEGVHPGISRSLALAPGEVVESVAYLVVADDVAQARLYRVLTQAGGLA
jgi:RimJ/RimL family protein N-acetyltransferase